MVIAKIKVDGVSAVATELSQIPKGIQGATIEVTYDGAWGSLNKTAVFSGSVVKDVVNAGAVISVPPETVAKSGHCLRVGFYGVDGENKMIMPTLWVDLGAIQSAADPSGDASTNPSLPVWAQLQAEVEALKETGGGTGTGATAEQAAQITKNKEDIENLSKEKLDASKLPEAVKESVDAFGAISYNKQTLTEEQQAQARENIGAVSADDVEAIINGGGEQQSITGEVVALEVGAGKALSILSKINRDSAWDLSNKLVLHQVSGKNFIDLSAYLGGAGTVFEKNGITATINADSTLTVQGTNSNSGWTPIIDKYFWTEGTAGEVASRVYPAGVYVIPSGLNINILSAQHPTQVKINGLTGNLQGTITVPEPFRIPRIFYPVAPNATVNKTIPLGIFRDGVVPEEGFEYSGNIYRATFAEPVYDGEFNWQTGELKDADGKTVAKYPSHSITSIPGTNYFWTGFGEITVAYHAGFTEEQKAQKREQIGAASAQEVSDLKTNLKQPWKDRIWSAVGDSLTDKHNSTDLNYHDYIAKATGITVINLGYSGSGYAKEGTGQAFHLRIANISPDSDVVTIFGSFNDFGACLELGTATDTGTGTICGCINTTIDNLLAVAPAVSLGIVTPTPWKSSNPADENNNHTKYVNALVEICKNRSIPCLDLYRCSNLRPWTEEGRTACYSKDGNNGIHPNETGHKLIAARFKAFLESLII